MNTIVYDFFHFLAIETIGSVVLAFCVCIAGGAVLLQFETITIGIVPPDGFFHHLKDLVIKYI
jgi:hypothetical protein